MARYSPATTMQCSRLHLIYTSTIHVARPCQCTLTPHYVQPGTGLATWLSLHWWHAMLAMMDSANRASPSDAMVGSLITSCSTAHPRQLPWNTVSRHHLRRRSLVKEPQNEDRLQDYTCALQCCCKGQNTTIAFISGNAFATQQHCLLLSSARAPTKAGGCCSAVIARADVDLGARACVMGQMYSTGAWPSRARCITVPLPTAYARPEARSASSVVYIVGVFHGDGGKHTL